MLKNHLNLLLNSNILKDRHDYSIIFKEPSKCQIATASVFF